MYSYLSKYFRKQPQIMCSGKQVNPDRVWKTFSPESFFSFKLRHTEKMFRPEARWPLFAFAPCPRRSRQNSKKEKWRPLGRLAGRFTDMTVMLAAINVSCVH